MSGGNTILTGIVGSGRLDRALSDALPEISRARIQALAEESMVEVDGEAVSQLSSRKYTGKPFTISIPPPRPDKAQPQNIAINIVHEDNDLLVVDKAAGMVVHPSAGHHDGTLVNALLHHCRGRLSGIGGVERPGIVHRIDRDTSGLLVVAKTDKAHEYLAKLFAAHDIERKYLGIVKGIPAPPAGKIATQIGRSPKDRKKMAVLPEGQGKHAATHYRVEKPLTGAALTVCRLETGRTHQIRVHLAHIGHALIGDPVYANRQKPVYIGPNRSKFDRQALHAGFLGFIHPVSGKKMRFESNLPADMQELLSELSV
ncbi:MAG: RluA family pseudouridine synthase [Sphingorhabdus sp.]